jgi:hypothetical protein
LVSNGNSFPKTLSAANQIAFRVLFSAFQASDVEFVGRAIRVARFVSDADFLFRAVREKTLASGILTTDCTELT